MAAFVGIHSYRQIEEMMGERGFEIMHMIRKRQLRSAEKLRLAQQFYSLAG